MDWDRKLIVILTGTAPDCGPKPEGPWVVCNSSKTEQKGGLAECTRAKLLTKIHQNVHQSIVFYVMSAVQIDWEDASAGIGIFLNQLPT
jgi:hypothetical protein